MPYRDVEKRREWDRLHRDRSRARAATQRWRKRNPEPVGIRLDRHLRSTYGITVEEYNRLLAGQGNVCAICGRPEAMPDKTGQTQRLSVDHDHKSGAIRGLLCNDCNVALGRLKEDSDLLLKAYTYLMKERKCLAGETCQHNFGIA